MTELKHMRKQTPYRIWVCNKADGTISFGEYIRAKRRVFLCGVPNETLSNVFHTTIANWKLRNPGRSLEWAGDKLSEQNAQLFKLS